MDSVPDNDLGNWTLFQTGDSRYIFIQITQKEILMSNHTNDHDEVKPPLKERIKNSVAETKERVEAHIQENWKVYVTHGVALVVGGVAAGLTQRYICDEEPQNADVSQKVGVAINSVIKQDVTITQIKTNGHPGNVIEDLTTGKTYYSQREAAKAMGVSDSTIARGVESGIVKTPDGDHKIVNHGINTGFNTAN